MSMLVQDLIVSIVAFAAVTTIGVRARSMFGSKRSGAACGSCAKCPTAATAIPAGNLTASPAEQSRIIRLTVIPASSARPQR